MSISYLNLTYVVSPAVVSLQVTELIYIHSKLMIVDDNTVILGSANINDRSMLGKRDSELAIICRDRKREKIHLNDHVLEPGPFASSLRHTLFREHLGLTEGKEGVDLRDITCDSFYKDVWIHQAAVNTFVFDKVSERERGRQSVCACDRERACVCVCVFVETEVLFAGVFVWVCFGC